MEDAAALAWGHLIAGSGALWLAARTAGGSLAGFARSPLAVFLAYFGFAFLVVPGFNLAFGIAFWQASYRPESIERSLLLSLLFAAAAWAGWLACRPAEPAAPGDVRPLGRGPWLATLLALALVGFSGLGLLAKSVRDAGGLSNYFLLRNLLATGEGPSLLLTAVWQAIPALLVVELRARRLAQRPTGWLPWLLAGALALAVAVGLFQGSRTKALFPILAAGLCWAALRTGELPRRSKLGLLAAAASLAVLGGLLGIARESVAAGQAVRSEAFAGPRLVTEAFREYENLWYLVEHEARLEPLGGSSFLAGVVFWVPRSLWPDKPFGGGPELVNFIWPWGYEPGRTDNRSSITPGLMAEGYMNFGWPGIPLVGAFYGLGLGLLARFWSCCRRGYQVGLAVCLTLRGAEFLGMEFFGGLFNLLAVALPFLVAWAAEARLAEGSERTEPVPAG
ncbi:MAG: oligosaccharide repeat unit polymerase [Fimbriimonadales bacterium]|nr:oligosaccharide repeat unit polymerase [Fimbriimonadales bacterium]